MKKFLRFPLYAAMAAMMTTRTAVIPNYLKKIKDIRLLLISLPRIQ